MFHLMVRACYFGFLTSLLILSRSAATLLHARLAESQNLGALIATFEI